MKTKKIIIMAGGTCGHILPGLEIAFYLIEKGWKVFWLGTSNRIEAKLIPKYGININYIDIDNINNKNFINLIKLSINIIKAYYQARIIIKKINPNIILGMGSYISVPGALVAYFHKKPLLIHEQNRVPGLANKLLSKLSTINMQAFPHTLTHAITVGNPIRKSISQLLPPEDRLKNRLGPLRILVLGGSQGTEIFNQVIPNIAQFFKKKMMIWHQTGKKNIINTIQLYKKINTNIYKITPFIENISLAYNWADLTICRSGALTVSELEHIGLPAIFVPFPHKDKHQYWNALPLTLMKGAKILQQSEFNIKNLISVLNKLNRKKLIFMAKNIYSRSKLSSVKKITTLIEKTIANS